MAWLPTAYKSDILDAFTTIGTSGVYNKATGQGVGLQWVQTVPKGKGGWVANANYVVAGPCPTGITCSAPGRNGIAGGDSQAGIFNSESGLNALAQLGYKANNWGAAFGYRYGSQGSNVRDGNGLAAVRLLNNQYSNSIAFNAYWQPIKTGWFPSISGGYGYNFVSNMNGLAFNNNTVARPSKSWMVGLQWDNAFRKTNAAGIAVGQPSYSTVTGAQSSPWLVEWFYRIQATDNITITPTLFYGTNIANSAASATTTNAFNGLGGVIQTTFKF